MYVEMYTDSYEFRIQVTTIRCIFEFCVGTKVLRNLDSRTCAVFLVGNLRVLGILYLKYYFPVRQILTLMIQC